MKRIWPAIIKASKGEVSPWQMVLAVFVVVILTPLFITLSMIFSESAAEQKLLSGGHIVMAAGEYDDLMTVLNNVHDDASAAVVAAQVAALRSESADNTAALILDKLVAFNENEMFLFPDSTNKNVTLTAGAAHTFSAWTEVVDNTSTTLTSKFAVTAGYIREVTLYAYSVAEKICILELGYGQNIGAVTTIGRCFVRSDWTYVLPFFSESITAGEKVYYRFMSEQAGETFKANFKYCYVV